MRVAFITNHPVAKVVINTVVRWTFGERISHAPHVAAALLHMGVPATLEKSIVAEIGHLRDLGLREAV